MGVSCQGIPFPPHTHNVLFRKLSFFSFRRILEKHKKRLHRMGARRGVICQLIMKKIQPPREWKYPSPSTKFGWFLSTWHSCRAPAPLLPEIRVFLEFQDSQIRHIDLCNHLFFDPFLWSEILQVFGDPDLLSILGRGAFLLRKLCHRKEWISRSNANPKTETFRTLQKNTKIHDFLKKQKR